MMARLATNTPLTLCSLTFCRMQVELSNYEKYLKYRRPEGFEFQYSGDKTYVLKAISALNTIRPWAGSLFFSCSFLTC